MTLDNMVGITNGSYTGFCKSQLITCNRVKECNGVCPFEDALKHADKTADEQNVIDHDRDWIIGCLQHDGFIHTHRFDKANQIILEALSAEAPKPTGDLISRADAIALLTEIVFDEPPYFDSETLCRLYAEEQINTLPSAEIAETESIVIRSRTLMPTKDFMEWAKRIREVNPNAIVIPCDAEVVSPKPYREDGEEE